MTYHTASARLPYLIRPSCVLNAILVLLSGFDELNIYRIQIGPGQVNFRRLLTNALNTIARLVLERIKLIPPSYQVLSDSFDGLTTSI